MDIIKPIRENRTLRVISIIYAGEHLNVIKRINFYDMFRNELVVSKEFPSVHWQCLPLNSTAVVATTLRYGIVDSVDQCYPWWQNEDTLVPRPTKHSNLSILEGGKAEWPERMRLDWFVFALKKKVVHAYTKGNRIELQLAMNALYKYKGRTEHNLKVLRR